MENKKTAHISRLFVIIFVFVASIFLLNSQKRKSMFATHLDTLHAPADVPAVSSLDQAYHYINSLLISHNTDLIVKVINQSMAHCSVDLIKKIIVDNGFFLSDTEKMSIIFGAALYPGSKKMVQYRILDFLLEYPALWSYKSALLVLMRSKYSDGLPVFLNWLREKQKEQTHANVWGLFVDHALHDAIDQNDCAIFEVMLSKKIRIAPEKASQFLWYVVTTNKDKTFVPLLVRYAQADINYVVKGKTLLIEAVEQNNKDMIHVLLEEGAVVDRVVNPEQGTALQIARARNDSSVLELLREYGA